MPHRYRLLGAPPSSGSPPAGLLVCRALLGACGASGGPTGKISVEPARRPDLCRAGKAGLVAAWGMDCCWEAWCPVFRPASSCCCDPPPVRWPRSGAALVQIMLSKGHSALAVSQWNSRLAAKDTGRAEWTEGSSSGEEINKKEAAEPVLFTGTHMPQAGRAEGRGWAGWRASATSLPLSTACAVEVKPGLRSQAGARTKLAEARCA